MATASKDETGHRELSGGQVFRIAVFGGESCGKSTFCSQLVGSANEAMVSTSMSTLDVISRNSDGGGARESSDGPRSQVRTRQSGARKNRPMDAQSTNTMKTCVVMLNSVVHNLEGLKGLGSLQQQHRDILIQEARAAVEREKLVQRNAERESQEKRVYGVQIIDTPTWLANAQESQMQASYKIARDLIDNLGKARSEVHWQRSNMTAGNLGALRSTTSKGRSKREESQIAGSLRAGSVGISRRGQNRISGKKKTPIGFKLPDIDDLEASQENILWQTVEIGGVLVLFDCRSLESLDVAQTILERIHSNVIKENINLVPVILFCNMVDGKGASVDHASLEEFANSKGCYYTYGSTFYNFAYLHGRKFDLTQLLYRLIATMLQKNLVTRGKKKVITQRAVTPIGRASRKLNMFSQSDSVPVPVTSKNAEPTADDSQQDTNEHDEGLKPANAKVVKTESSGAGWLCW